MTLKEDSWALGIVMGCAVWVAAEYLLLNFLWGMMWGVNSAHAIVAVVLFVFVVLVLAPIDVIVLLAAALVVYELLT